MKILIVDDEKLARQRLMRMLGTMGYEDITEVENAKDVLELVKDDSFDIVFLDINMPEIGGLELGYEIKYIDPSIAIIYQSAYDEHALKAYDIGAIGYLVKPFSNDSLKQAIERVSVQKDQKSDEFKILSKMGSDYLLLKPEDIHYVKADLSEVIIRTKEGFSYYSQKISQLENKLEPFGFFKIHRSYLINTNEIKNIKTIEQSKLRFSFKNNSDEIDSSKDGAKLFREKFLV